jgi:hypothetical protein
MKKSITKINDAAAMSAKHTHLARDRHRILPLQQQERRIPHAQSHVTRTHLQRHTANQHLADLDRG